jgi:hypothetical protein
MVERDPLERRQYQATVPDDLNDPAQFGQISETVKDAVVLELRHWFNQPNLNTGEPERRREIPTVRKYAVGFGPGTDPYETIQQILNDFADTPEKLPHVAVTAVQGKNDRMTAGQPFIGHVQLPPRVETGNPEPYALGASQAEVWTVFVTDSTPGDRVAVDLLGTDYAYIIQVGDTTQSVAKGLRDALRGAEPLFTFARSGSTITITYQILNTPFTPAVTAGLTAAQVQAAGTATTDQLAFSTTPDQQPDDLVEETVVFRADRFPPANPVTAALAVDVARVFNEQARFAMAKVIPMGGGKNGVRFFTGGRAGGQRTPNLIEVSPDTSANALAAFGLGTSGTGSGVDAISGSPPDTPMTLATPGIGTAVAASVATGVDAYVTLGGPLALSNTGRFKVLSVVGPNTITYDNPAGTPESFNGGTWFVGKRDSWTNPARPMMNRRHVKFQMTVTLSVLAEDPNDRDELHDLVLNQFAYYLEIKHFQILGRGVLDPDNFPNEHYQIGIGQDIAPAGTAQIQRAGGDVKNYIYEARISLPLTLFMYQDRSVLVPYGPKAGQSYVVTAEDVIPRDIPGVVTNDFSTNPSG